MQNHQRAQAALVKSRLGLTSTLRDKKVANLTSVTAHTVPVEWLERETQADFDLAPEISRPPTCRRRRRSRNAASRLGGGEGDTYRKHEVRRSGLHFCCLTPTLRTRARPPGGPGATDVASSSFFHFFLDTPRGGIHIDSNPRTGVEVVGQAGPAKFNGERLKSPIVPPCSPSFLCCSSPTTS